jgi:hypothetical protein
MKASVITHLPFNSPSALLGNAAKRRDLAVSDIAELLRRSPVRFVVADVGMPLQWINEDDRFEFWKLEAKPHVSDKDTASLEEFPGGYCYFASLWDDGGSPIVLLSKCH